MIIQGFLDIEFESDIWTFFGLSCNYQTGQVFMYMKMFDLKNKNALKKKTEINFKEFRMKKFGEVIFGGVENNPYF